MVLLKKVDDLYNKFSNAVYESGHLDNKTKELIALSNSIMMDCKPCMKWHYEHALKAGATTEEIAETVALTMTVSAGKRRHDIQEIIAEYDKNKK
jgi:AhpD family alkylhydroperoxidase